MDPVVCIQVGDQRKYTSVKESTNCPYYNEVCPITITHNLTSRKTFPSCLDLIQPNHNRTHNYLLTCVHGSLLPVFISCRLMSLGGNKEEICNGGFLVLFVLQYFVFDFHMPAIMLFDKIITLSVSIRSVV